MAEAMELLFKRSATDSQVWEVFFRGRNLGRWYTVGSRSYFYLYDASALERNDFFAPNATRVRTFLEKRFGIEGNLTVRFDNDPRA